MKKNVLFLCFLVISLCLCLTFSVGILVYGPSQAGANEQLAEPPVLLTEEGSVNKDVLSQTSDWIRDHFFLRQELISIDHFLSARLFRTSGDAGVILGSDGWLYYTDTLDDYTGTNLMSERELFAAAKNLSLMAQYCQENNRQFLFVIAPNKNSLYNEHMPNFGARAEKTNASTLLALLEDAGVKTVDLFESFTKESETLYFAHDSHWNTKGAALGADLINAAFGVESHYYEADFSKTVPNEGDLYDMLYPAFADTERDYVYGGTLEYQFTTSATRPNAILLNTEGRGRHSLLAYRDSFGNLLFPFLADSSATARFSRATAYDLTHEADCVLIELVERNLNYLIENLPVMPAPQVTIVLPETVSGTVAATTAKRGDWLQIKGQLPSVDTNSSVYVVCGTAVYEAFCMEDAGFGVNLDPNLMPSHVVCTTNDTLTMYQLEIS